MKEILIEVTEDGNVKIEAVGFSGNACKQYTKAFEEALGVVASTKNKPEFFQTTQTTQKVGGK